ncbi:MAG TPA: thiolase domain-containing protein [Candidatus Polarisedimenticolia bacterium]|nr:thiolase domain-containing protein [Candidatus Polarisedimenticolia bacterium]
MREVSIIGIGQTAVAEHWDRSIRDLAVEAVGEARRDAGVERVDALYAGNMLSGELAGQENLATLIADAAGLLPVEAMKIEAACASGGAALRAAYLAVASGAHDYVLAVGVEKMTDLLTDGVTAALATAADADYEAGHGIPFVALNALLMRRYMHEHKVRHEEFAPFSINSHRNAAQNPRAMYRQEISAEDFARSPLVSDPINILDSAGICDGAAALLLAPSSEARRARRPPVRLAASACTTDTVGLAERRDPLVWQAVADSARLAYAQAKIGPKDIDLFEVHDAFSIVSVLSLEACGFADRGSALKLAAEGRIAREGDIPICTLGGLKGRGHPVGASGAYQAVEVVLQLRGEAGGLQIKGARTGMAQSVGGSGSVAITHILQV